MAYNGMTLRLACEEGREIGVPTSTYLSATGEPYVVIGSQFPGASSISGTVNEGEASELAFDEETAYWASLAAFTNYAEGRVGKIYWRKVPTLEWTEDGARCVFYMRCLISDKPEITL